MNEKILVVDDERSIVDILKFNLQKEGFQVFTGFDGQEALDMFEACTPDLILLDVMMPKLSGYDVCRKVREKSMVPIIMLTARTEEMDTVLGLELGADDYVTKPFGIRELMARVRANLRRSVAAKPKEEAGDLLRCGAISLNAEKYEAFKDGHPLELTLREVELLKFLMYQRGQIFSREYLLEKVWGYEYYGDARTVDVTVRRLREKIENVPSAPEYLLTKRGLGYYFTDKEPE
ncbi:MAG: response regulator transcription factor [Firmicutes bacterium]|nr:response regulator transcription factor [Bacillota bacterium]